MQAYLHFVAYCTTPSLAEMHYIASMGSKVPV
jgi:hypothetical protein